MRPIKFRAWDKGTKRMTQVKNLYIGGNPSAEIWINESDECYGYVGRDIELMQFTGLKDKNGKEIYEGDIIYEGDSKRSFKKWAFEDWIGAEEWGIVEYRNGSFVVDFYSIYGGEGTEILGKRLGYTKRFRVIGNIYENPELLKGRK